jgi:hypothetical protein
MLLLIVSKNTLFSHLQILRADVNFQGDTIPVMEDANVIWEAASMYNGDKYEKLLVCRHH